MFESNYLRDSQITSQEPESFQKSESDLLLLPHLSLGSPHHAPSSLSGIQLFSDRSALYSVSLTCASAGVSPLLTTMLSCAGGPR